VCRHIAGGRCTARIDRSYICSLKKRKKISDQSEAELYIGCILGYTYTHRASIQPLHKKSSSGTPKYAHTHFRV